MKGWNLYISAVAVLCLSGCTSSPKAGTANNTIANNNTKSGYTTTAPSNTATSFNTANNTTKSIDNSQLLSGLAQKLLQYKLDKLPDSLTICSINNIPITVGDYRREFKIEQQEIQAALTYNAKLANQLLQAAHQQGIALSKEERITLLKSTNKMQMGGQKSFDQMLKESHMDKKQFDKQVIDMGLACKAANMLIENNLLNEIVNHLLLSQAAKSNGFSKDAMNKYAETTRSDAYKKMLATGAFSADDLRDEIINNELRTKQTEKIQSESPLTDVELNDFYEKNRGKLRHSNRVRLSHIFIALPNKPDEQKEKYKLAQSYLERVQKGENFGTLADQYSEDPNKKKNDGGDLGFQEESKLTPDFAAKVAKLPSGTVVSEVMISPHGYHIFKVTEREKPGFYRLAEVKEQLKGVLGQQKGKQTVSDWLIDQRQKATVVISPELKNLLAANKLEKREGIQALRQKISSTQLSGQGQHF